MVTQLTNEQIDAIPYLGKLTAQGLRDFAREVECRVLETNNLQSLRDDGFVDGVLLALQLLTTNWEAGSSTYVSLLKTAGLERVVQRAVQRDMFETVGLNALMPEEVREAIVAAKEPIMSVKQSKVVTSPTNKLDHDLYKTGDADAPEQIKDRNGDVVLSLCRRCGKGGIDLSEGCTNEG